jgi:hypothetical protein
MPKRARSNPRVTIYENSRATLSGLDYHDLRSILTQAALHNYAELDRLKDEPEAEQHARDSLALIARIERVVLDAIGASHHPSPSDRTGWRTPAVSPLRAVPKAERWRRARQEKGEREWFDKTMASLLAERERRMTEREGAAES